MRDAWTGRDWRGYAGVAECDKASFGWRSSGRSGRAGLVRHVMARFGKAWQCRRGEGWLLRALSARVWSSGQRIGKDWEGRRGGARWSAEGDGENLLWHGTAGGVWVVRSGAAR